MSKETPQDQADIAQKRGAKWNEQFQCYTLNGWYIKGCKQGWTIGQIVEGHYTALQYKKFLHWAFDACRKG